jgi:uncharacterized protein (DUF1778 family)
MYKEPAMSATARLVVQMTPAEKTLLDQRANRAGISTSEFVRRRIAGDSLEDNREEIEAFLTALESSAPSILRGLDEAIAEAAALTAAINARGEVTQA